MVNPHGFPIKNTKELLLGGVNPSFSSFPNGQLRFYRVNPLFSGTIQPSNHQDSKALTAQDGLLLNLGREAPNAVTRKRFLTDQNGDFLAVQQCNNPKWGIEQPLVSYPKCFFLDELEILTLEIQIYTNSKICCLF